MRDGEPKAGSGGPATSRSAKMVMLTAPRSNGKDFHGPPLSPAGRVEGSDPHLEGATLTSKERPSASPRAPLQVDWWPIRDATCPEAFPLHAGTRTAPVDLVCAPCALRQIMPRQGPCAHKQCPKPHESSGQWHWLPEGWDPSDIRSGATCVCKKAGCLRHFEMREPTAERKVF